MYTFKIKLFETQRIMQFLPKSFMKLLRDCKSRFECFQDDRGIAREGLKLIAIIYCFKWDLNGILSFAVFFEIKGYFAKKVSSDFSYTLT